MTESFVDAVTVPQVIVGVDDKAAGLAALRYAVAEARRRGMPLHAVRIQHTVCPGDFLDIDLAFALAFGGYPEDVPVYRELQLGAAGPGLAARPHNPADLLVVGTSGRGWWHALWSGSASRVCLRKARCQVLIVPGPELGRRVRGRRFSLVRKDDLWDEFDRAQSTRGQ